MFGPVSILGQMIIPVVSLAKLVKSKMHGYVISMRDEYPGEQCLVYGETMVVPEADDHLERTINNSVQYHMHSAHARAFAVFRSDTGN